MNVRRALAPLLAGLLGLAGAPQPLLEHALHGGGGRAVQVERRAESACEAEKTGEQRRERAAHVHIPYT